MRHARASRAGEPSAEHQVSSRRWPAALTISAAAAGLVAIGVPAWAAASAASPSAAGAPAATANSFKQTNLIANKASFGAKLTDKNLINAWGLAAGPSTPIWVSDNNSGFATVYSGGIKGSPVSLDLTVPVPGGNPTGQVFNPDASAFPVGGPKGTAADFIVGTDSIGATQSPGEIAAWNGGASFVVEDSPAGGAAGKTPAHAVLRGWPWRRRPRRDPSCSPRTWPTPRSTCSTGISA
jgi:hypothetical protein